ncbi:MAG: S8 family serine peptidase [Patescibacteria group bacterium]
MRRISGLSLLVLLILSLAGCAFNLPGSGGGPDIPSLPGDAALAEHLRGTVLVRLAGIQPEEAASAVGGTIARARGDLVRIKLPSGASVSEAVKTLATRPGVACAEPVYIYQTPVVDTDPDRMQPARALTPDYSANQWAPGKINAGDVWSLSPDASGVIVAVVDTGIDLDNPEFAGRILEGYNAITAEEGPTVADDDYGHGTHVAGIIGAAHETPDQVGIRGLAGDVKLMPVKVLDADGYGYNDEIAAGINWAADHGADVINMSLGGRGRSQVIQDAVDHAVRDHGVIVVAAMGNSYRPGWTHYPAACEGVIAVGATRPDGTKADFSSEGPHISVAAPGEDIFSCVWTAEGPTYASWSGTSMAAPHVAGLVALLLSANPDAKPTKIRSVLEGSTGTSTWCEETGNGQIDAYAAYSNYDAIADVYGELAVTVTHGGLPAPGAEVLIQTQTGATATSSRTNENGVAYFHLLRAGTYQVRVTYNNGAAGSQSGVVVTGGGSTPVAVVI